MKRRAVMICMTVALAGCATQWDVDRFEAADAKVATRQTFYWRGGDVATTAPLDPAARARADSAIRQTVTSALVRKGYEELRDPATAQLLVGCQISGQRRFELADDRRVGAPSPTTVLSPSEVQPPPASTLPREMQLRDASVLVFADDPATGKLVWRGLVTAELRIGSSEEGVRIINEMARQIIEQFPPRAAPP